MDIKDFKGHIFDLDGTLTRSNHVWSKIDEEFLGKRGIKVPEDYFKQVSARGAVSTWTVGFTPIFVTPAYLFPSISTAEQ